MKKRMFVMMAMLMPLVVLSGCGERQPSTRFQMPDGNAEQGRTAFVALQCVQCHRVAGVADLPAPTADPTQVVTLGGEVTNLRSYGDLITSIIHPSHRVSELMPAPAPKVSPMPNVNDQMTVSQLINLVAFLYPRYEELEPIYQTYPPYYFP